MIFLVGILEREWKQEELPNSERIIATDGRDLRSDPWFGMSLENGENSLSETRERWKHLQSRERWKLSDHSWPRVSVTIGGWIQIVLFCSVGFYFSLACLDH
jgi:hypothetical protein